MKNFRTFLLFLILLEIILTAAEGLDLNDMIQDSIGA